MTNRPEKVDLTQFEGMTPGPWKFDGNTDVWRFGDGYQGQPHVIDPHVYLFSIRWPHDHDVNPCDSCKAHRAAIASLPSLIADLRATREERDKVLKVLNLLTVAIPNPVIIDDLETDEEICLCPWCGQDIMKEHDSDCPYQQARALLRELEAE